ncbi:hypothetical protein Dpoa2040_003407 [Dickeya sp. CFBP 2040]|uniref:Uncharacterized protein n=2 Tax=Dickeya poaceiphila TaxID=568768 RepID=A0A5B8IDM3_9GAMM|nr:MULTISPECIES: hypothetical protein [Dickeya]NKI76070.1 hypothetical protein [Dickeya sp. CFBP 2040]QDX31548.1 hypothetical protein Dpoa569_0003595 [Dickeya poaceiphila]
MLPTGSCGAAPTKTAALNMFPPGKLFGIIRAEEVNSSRKMLSFRGGQSVAGCVSSKEKTHRSDHFFTIVDWRADVDRSINNQNIVSIYLNYLRSDHDYR